MRLQRCSFHNKKIPKTKAQRRTLSTMLGKIALTVNGFGGSPDQTPAPDGQSRDHEIVLFGIDTAVRAEFAVLAVEILSIFIVSHQVDAKPGCR